MEKVTGKKEEVRGGNAKAVGKQVYLRWAGQRNGERFETVGSGPWNVAVDGNVVLLDYADDEELERDRSYLEKNQGVTDTVLQMCYPVDGKLETWSTVTNAKRGVETGGEFKPEAHHG